MKKPVLLLSALLSAVMLSSTAPVLAQSKEQFIPVLSYRTGPYAPNGTPWANGFVDYLKLVNSKGGINNVKISYEECETGYDTARSVECYERLKSKNPSFVQTLSTGATFAITEKAPGDKIPVLTVGYGRSESADGAVFKWNFPIAGTYWVAADTIMQAIAKKEGGWDKLKGKKVALVYHDYVVLWGWGVMNSTAIKEAQATGYAREKMYGVWWAGAEQDVKDVADGAKGYNAVTIQHGAEPNADIVKTLLTQIHAKGQGTGSKEEVGQVLYLRGVMSAMIGIEGIRSAQERFGKGKVMTGEQVRWGLENLNLTQAKLDALGFKGVMRPISTSCMDHMGAAWTRIHTWDGKKWVFTSDWMQADEQILKPLVKATADKYAAEKKLTRRTGQDCQS